MTTLIISLVLLVISSSFAVLKIQIQINKHRNKLLAYRKLDELLLEDKISVSEYFDRANEVKDM